MKCQLIFLPNAIPIPRGRHLWATHPDPEAMHTIAMPLVEILSFNVHFALLS